MKVVILAGGLPSTINGEDEKIPKPMAEIGGRPILWHIMKHFSAYGFSDFIICTGYKGEMIKQYFMDYYIYQSDITVDLQKNEVQIHRKKTEKWNVAIVDTGLETSVVDRIGKIKDLIGQNTFIVVYGDCVSDINVNQMIIYHKENKRWATIAVARPTGRNKILSINDQSELLMQNKEYIASNAWVNACCMIFEPEIFTYTTDCHNLFEKGLFEALSLKNQIITYKHPGFWSPMETRRDRAALEEMWINGNAAWKIWD